MKRPETEIIKDLIDCAIHLKDFGKDVDDLVKEAETLLETTKPVNVGLADVSKCDHQWIDINGGFKKLCIKCEKKEYQ